MSLSYFSLFTGAGGACKGAQAAGLTCLGGVELDPYPAALYEANFGHPLRQENILDTPIHELPDFDFLWASPSCVNFSTAKTDGGELAIDLEIAKKVAEFIRLKRPRHFALENVRGYADSESFAAILSRLEVEGYNCHWAIYDAASFAVPQNRNRLILRASRDPLGDLLPTHSKHGGLWWQPWNGWYDAVSDLLPSCKPSHLTDRQILALEKKGSNRAVLLERVGYGKERDPTIRTADDPSITIKAAAGCDERGGFRSPLTALLESADIRALDYRCLARLQSFPNDYKWGSSAGKNCRAIGNACPSLFAQRIIESIVGASK